MTSSAKPTRAVLGSGSLAQRLGTAVPSIMPGIVGTALWSGAMAASAAAGLLARGWSASPNLAFLSGLFAVAGLLAFLPATVGARMLSAHGSREFRLAVNLLLLAAGTVSAAALLYAWHYRVYYGGWHGPAFSKVWLIQLGFTGLTALYQFAVLGTRLFFPIGFFALLVAAFWLAWSPSSAGER